MMFSPPVYSSTFISQAPFYPGLKRNYSFSSSYISPTSGDLESAMARVPLVGRLYFREYVALVLSFFLVTLEFLARIITLTLPAPIINFLYSRSRALFKLLPSTKESKIDKKSSSEVVKKIRDADGFVEMCEIWGYEAEEHIVQTKDGYLLGLHRIPRAKDEPKPKRGEKGKEKKGVVYLHHGLMMNSEVWVCNIQPNKCLPFVLAEQGYDVWLGNNRGNKYSKKCIYTNSQDTSFWNFSIDEFAMHDIPDSISYILLSTKAKSISYVGFSQGTAQAFAALSIHPSLNEIIDVFVALAPAMSPAGLYNSIVDALIKTSPDVIFLFFGRRSLLPSTMFWQSILYPPIFVTAIDKSLKFLFNWSGKNISLQQKLASYAHLYSFTSVKALVHWFQIIRNKKFQMYDDDVQSPIGWGYGRSYYKPAKFPTKNISAPVVLVYGGSDSLVDIEVMLKELPGHTVAKEIKHYEHLDFLWGEENDKLVIPEVLDALERYGDGRDGTIVEKDEEVVAAIVGGEPPGYSEDEKNEREKEDKKDEEEKEKKVTEPVDVVVTSSSTPPPPPASDKSSSTAPSSYSSSLASVPMWPAWLSGRTRLRRSPSVASLTSVSSGGSDNGASKNRGVVFGPGGMQVAAGKASSAVSTTVLGEGEELVEKKRRRRRERMSMRPEHHSY
ncbi:cholesterol esterase [Orbilia oligospora]|uniref:Cholesterol esterase n=1 Tax=Orbilia oligospora TaxID=2813651 RepID=A0A7C8KJB7_ORBOL|nr:cholesterol esterase [Orbilia oligospora]KAF3205798.1 cholesterol esterase [Orbilia oligospora]KAF3216754.1 cholesterol esterase [Orbilia oligospora]